MTDNVELREAFMTLHSNNLVLKTKIMQLESDVQLYKGKLSAIKAQESLSDAEIQSRNISHAYRLFSNLKSQGESEHSASMSAFRSLWSSAFSHGFQSAKLFFDLQAEALKVANEEVGLKDECNASQATCRVPVNEWKDAVLDQLAIHALDASIDTPPAEIVKLIIDTAVMIATYFYAKQCSLQAGESDGDVGYEDGCHDCAKRILEMSIGLEKIDAVMQARPDNRAARWELDQLEK